MTQVNRLHVRVKTAKGRKPSSTAWLERQLNDPYVKLAKKEGYRSRAAYKLIEMDEKFHLLKPNMVVVDLGCAPGGWLQVLSKKVKNGKIIGLDLLEVEPIDNVDLLQCDFTSEEGYKLLQDILGNNKADIILSDMAPSSCGHTQTDHIRIMSMCEMALDFAKNYLKEGGTFVAKVLKGGSEKSMLDDMKKYFKVVKHAKPNASRKDSSEMYVVATGFRTEK